MPYKSGMNINTTVPHIFLYEPPMDPYITVLYQDDDIIVLNKASGLLHVPGKDPSLKDCLESRVKEQFPRASVIHRIDKDTSGVAVMAMHKKAHGFIGKQFEYRETKKSYVARVWGHLEGDSGHIDLPLAVDWHNRPCQQVDYVNGRPAQTDWEVIAREDNATRVRLYPRTGRTHQLRVHMLALCHPILGDSFYAVGDALAAADRLQLHAEQLTFRHPATNEEVTFTAPCPF